MNRVTKLSSAPGGQIFYFSILHILQKKDSNLSKSTNVCQFYIVKESYLKVGLFFRVMKIRFPDILDLP